MSCKIIYNNQNYTIKSFKDYLVKNKNLFLQDFISQDIEGFKKFVGQKGGNYVEGFSEKGRIKPNELTDISQEEWEGLTEEEKTKIIKCM